MKTNTIDRLAMIKEAMQKADAKKQEAKRKSSNYASRILAEAKRVSKLPCKFNIGGEP